MKPTTPAEAIALVEHRRIHKDHEGFGCCTPWEFDLANADDLVKDLEEIGWDPPRPRLSLPTEAPKGKRETSRKAAASIADLRGGMKGVFELVAANGSRGLTDDEIAAQYDGFAERNGFARLAADSPRKRRMDLAEAGYLLDSGRTRPTRCGRDAVVWVARGESAVAA